jgi:predicted dehydrogenase
MWQAAEVAGVKHMTGFNYRFIPAVRYARELIDDGVLGRLYHFRGRWLYDGGDDPGRPYGSRFDLSRGGYGSLGNIGVHIIDLARYLMGEMRSVEGVPATFVKERPLPDGSGKMGRVTTDDAFVATVEFTSGAVGTLEASTVATGRRQNGWFEINGSKGSVIFDLERLNELRICRRGSTSGRAEGFTDVLMTERTHPFMEHWWVPGHIIGWEHTFVHEVAHFIRAVVRDEDVAPHGATFSDGYRAVAVTEAIRRSWETGRRVQLADEYASEVGA